MKKFAAAFIFLVSVFLFTGCSREEVPFTAKRFEAEEKVSAVTVDVRDRKIDVVLSEDGMVRIDYWDSEKEFFDIAVEDGVLTMTAADDKEWEDYIGRNASRENRTITLHLPEEGLSVLNLTTTNEDISLPAVSAGNIRLGAVNGNITFDRLNVGESLTLDGKNGDIQGKLLGTFDDFAMFCTTKKGACNLPETKEGGEKTLTVKANNGDVEIEFVK